MKRFLFIGVLVFVVFAGCEDSGFDSSDPNTEFAELKAEVAELKRILEGVDRGENTDGYDTITFSGVNVQIINGLGFTNSVNNQQITDGTGTFNGLGNLIVGYNEARYSGDNNRSGSHNIIVGKYHDYSSYGGLVAGNMNTISGPYSSVTGGSTNTADNWCSSVTGGYNNTANNKWSSVTGGQGTTASSEFQNLP